jgi:hypothetical protein
MPQLKDPLLNVQTGLADFSRLFSSFQEFLEISFQVNPAYLSLGERNPVVGRPAVRAQDAPDGRAQKLHHHGRISQPMDEEHHHLGSGHDPQPSFAPRFFPAGFVHMFYRRLAHCGHASWCALSYAEDGPADLPAFGQAFFS